ncbi:MAG TPA: TetR/AcrR family transcriptional regulator [Syntrophales bacterium]|jgi:AcrR family transcriptional regulator|nr:TetR/AcrR family transcriptional regulator [Syntrophales bacterium]
MGIAERKQREKESRSRQIQEIAAELFYKKGYAETSLDEIARRAEISKATIYLYFKSKDDLYYQIVEPALAELSRRLVSIAENSEEPAEITVRKIIDATRDVFFNDPGSYHLVSRYNAAEFKRLLPKNRLDNLKSLMRSNFHQMEQAVQKGIDQGVFHDADAKLVSIILWNCFMGVIQFQENRMDSERTDYRRPTIDAAVDLILKGLKSK